MRRALRLGAAFVLAAAAARAQARTGTWATDSAAPCAGLTVGWRVPAARLDSLVRPAGAAARGPDGRGVLLLFVTACPRSAIDGTPTGPVALGAVIVPLAAAPGGAPAARASALPEGFAAADHPVSALFSQFGYAMTAARVTLRADSSGGARRAAFTIATAGGAITVSAQFGDSAARFAVRSTLVATGAGGGEFAGPEWALRRRGTATVTATGATLVSRLGLAATPDFATWDEDFGWTFDFVRRQAPPASGGSPRARAP